MDSSDDASSQEENQLFQSDRELEICDSTQHSYLGRTENVRGFAYFEPHKEFEIPIFIFRALIIPGELIPMIMSKIEFDSLLKSDEYGLVFGLFYRKQIDFVNKIYGVICQVYEKGPENETVSIKAKAQQRFVMVNNDNGDLIVERNHVLYAKVRILPEFVLQDPFRLGASNSNLKYLQNTKNNEQIQKLLASSMGWPKFLYDHYSNEAVDYKIQSYLSMFNIKVPEDPVLKSFWLVKNIPLNQVEKFRIFKLDNVNRRFIVINNLLNAACFFSCKSCKNKIATYNDIFAMSKNAIYANYCSPSGYVHEIFTVRKTFDEAIVLLNEPSTEFTWFPGYSWQVALCRKCYRQIGWKFEAVNNCNLGPTTFFGLTCKQLSVKSNRSNLTLSLSDMDEETSSEFSDME